MDLHGRGGARPWARAGVALAGLALAGLALAAPARGQEAPAHGFGPAREVATLADPAIDEASGLAPSRRLPGALWVHNDSGDGPRLFLVEARTGRTLAVARIVGVPRGPVTTLVQAVDWEDVASFRHAGEAWLLVGDLGDNESKRPHVTLYLVREPDVEPPPPGAPPAELVAPVKRRIDVTYADGPHDCEALAVDPTDPAGPAAWLVTKERARGVKPKAYRLPLFGEQAGEQALTAVAEVDVPGLVTAGDMSPDGRRLVLLHYRDAYLFTRQDDEAWAAALGRAPVRIPMPRRKQGEALCFDDAGRALWLTSELPPAPLWEVPPADEAPPPPAPDAPPSPPRREL